MQISNKRVQLKKKKERILKGFDYRSFFSFSFFLFFFEKSRPEGQEFIIIGLLLKAFILIQKIHPKKGNSNTIYFSTILRYSILIEKEIFCTFGIQTLLGNYLGVCIRVQLRELDHLILTIHDE